MDTLHWGHLRQADTPTVISSLPGWEKKEKTINNQPFIHLPRNLPLKKGRETPSLIGAGFAGTQRHADLLVDLKLSLF